MDNVTNLMTLVQDTPYFILAIILAVLIAILALILAVLVIVLVLILILAIVLILILVIHCCSSVFFLCGCTAMLFCPNFQDLSLALKRTLAISPEKIAVVIPAAHAFKPPKNIPRNPSSRIA